MKMKSELTTAIVAAIVGVLISYFICGLFIGEIKDVSFKTVTTTVSSGVSEPDPEVFNPNALNPTVEVYVGECKEFDEAGNCKTQGGK